MTGSAFLPWGEIEPEKLRVIAGNETLLLDGDPQGPHAVRCRACSSRLYWTGFQGRIRVPCGTLTDAPTLRPTAHMFVGSKAPWYESTDELPQHDEYPWPSE